MESGLVDLIWMDGVKVTLHARLRPHLEMSQFSLGNGDKFVPDVAPHFELCNDALLFVKLITNVNQLIDTGI